MPILEPNPKHHPPIKIGALDSALNLGSLTDSVKLLLVALIGFVITANIRV